MSAENLRADDEPSVPAFLVVADAFFSFLSASPAASFVERPFLDAAAFVRRPTAPSVRVRLVRELTERPGVDHVFPTHILTRRIWARAGGARPNGTSRRAGQAATNQRMLKGRNRVLIDMIGFP